MATMMKTEAFRILEKITQNDGILERFYLSRPFSPLRRGSEASLQTQTIMGRLDKQRHSVLSSQKSPLFKKRRSTKTEMQSSTTTESVESLNKEVDMKKILFTLIDKADFLVEDDLNDMMVHLPNKEKLLVKVASILDTLGVKEASDLERIVKHLTAIGHKEGEEANFESTAEKRSQVKTFFFMNTSHLCFQLLKVLREFVEEEGREEQMYRKQQAMFGTLNLFQSVAGTIQPDREGQLWDEVRAAVAEYSSQDRAQLRGLLTQYKDILVARAELIKRNDTLRQQNAEMRNLLKNVIHKRGNKFFFKVYLA